MSLHTDQSTVGASITLRAMPRATKLRFTATAAPSRAAALVRVHTADRFDRRLQTLMFPFHATKGKITDWYQTDRYETYLPPGGVLWMSRWQNTTELGRCLHGPTPSPLGSQMNAISAPLKKPTVFLTHALNNSLHRASAAAPCSPVCYTEAFSEHEKPH